MRLKLCRKEPFFLPQRGVRQPEQNSSARDNGFLNCAALEIKDCDWSAVRNVDFADEAQYKRYRNELPDAAEVRYGGWKESVLQKWRRRSAGR